MCTRVLYETGTNTFIVGRSMDWNDSTAKTKLWSFPKGIVRDGGTTSNTAKWSSKYGSIVASFYDAGSADGLNEAGLVGNMLYLAESDFGDPAKTGKPTLSVAAWLQYFLDRYASVNESINAMKDEPFTIVAPILPNGQRAAAHLCLSDPTGDSAILEYINGQARIHHSPEYRVMTNSPVYEQQLALNTYWDLIGGNNMLPGTISAADRFVRTSYFLKSSPKFKERYMAVAAVFSQMRSIGVPLGMSDQVHPNISSTLWRSVIDHDAKRYYFESTIQPAIFWVDMDNLDLKEGASPQSLEVNGPTVLFGEVSSEFKLEKPFSWLAGY